MPLHKAIRLAEEKGLDLVEVAPNAQPPVCRILDYGKFKYELAKKEKQAKKHQEGEVSQIRFSTGIQPHDLEVKMQSIRRLLSKGNKVKVMVIFKGRAITHPELGETLLRRVSESLQDIARVEQPPKMDEKMMTMLLAPLKKS